jgi:hypothetical protein
MYRWLCFVAFMALTGCATDGYRYHEDGYWTARAPARSWSYQLDLNACSFWDEPYSYYGGYGGYGRGCGVSGFYFGSLWYAGSRYWRDPYWSQRWYLPRTLENPRAASRARALAAALAPRAQGAEVLGYEDLLTNRRRDIGGGDRSYTQSYRSGREPGPNLQGLGSARYGNRSGLAGPSASGMSSRSMTTSSSPRSMSARSANAAPARAAPSREREEN